MIIYQRVFKLWSGHEIASETIKENNPESIKRELSFLYVTYRHDLFYITIKYHLNIPNGSKRFSSYGVGTKLHLKPSMENNSESMKARVVILARDTLS